MTGTANDLAAMLSSLQVLFHISLAIALIIAAIVYAKRIGGFGPWIVAAIAAIDAGIVLLYRLASAFPYSREKYMVLALIDVAGTGLGAVLLVVAFGLMMKRA